jgi:hypothetical protein
MSTNLRSLNLLTYNFRFARLRGDRGRDMIILLSVTNWTRSAVLDIPYWTREVKARQGAEGEGEGDKDG